MKKTTLLTLTLVSLTILPAVAQGLDTDGLGQVWTGFQSYSVDLQNYLQNNLSETLKPLELRSSSAINNARGDLNIPDPITAGQRLRNDITINSISDRFENNSVVRSNAVSNEINRLITRGAVASILGENGQRRSKAKLENTEKSLETIAGTNKGIFQEFEDFKSKLTRISDVSQQATAQGLLSLVLTSQQTIQIQQEQAKIVAETFAQTLQTNQSLQYSNLNLATISQQMEETNRARRVDSSTEAARLLRVTSQMDLLGRKANK